MCGVDRQLDILGLGAGYLTDRLAGGGGNVVEVAPLDRRDPAAADEILIAAVQGNRTLKGLEVRSKRGALIHWIRSGCTAGVTVQGRTLGIHDCSPSGSGQIGKPPGQPLARFAANGAVTLRAFFHAGLADITDVGSMMAVQANRASTYGLKFALIWSTAVFTCSPTLSM